MRLEDIEDEFILLFVFFASEGVPGDDRVQFALSLYYVFQ